MGVETPDEMVSGPLDDDGESGEGGGITEDVVGTLGALKA